MIAGNIPSNSSTRSIAVIGGGFTGLAAAYDLARAGHQVTVFEQERALGGLAGVFELAPGIFLERFYHHWFGSDLAVLDWLREIGLQDDLISAPTNTGLYFANSIFRLSSPLDLLKFTPLPFVDRIRTGLMALAARRINDYRELESISAKDWIVKMAGPKSYEVIWAPLLNGKFGRYAADVSAVWFWNKLKLRGSSRGKSGEERLFYVRGGFNRALIRISEVMQELGVNVRLNSPVSEVVVDSGKIVGVRSAAGAVEKFDQVLVTTPAPIALQICPQLTGPVREQLSSIKFLGNVCLVLELSRSLSSTYWLNVADPTFPFVGVIEHTNFDSPEAYGGRHIAFLSKYLPVDEPLFSASPEEIMRFTEPHLKKMFPEFESSWVTAFHVWRERYSQPLVTKHYSQLIPPHRMPIDGLWLATMAQIYPEDRGTNYAVAAGRSVAKMMLEG